MTLVQAFLLSFILSACSFGSAEHHSKPVLLDVKSYSFEDFCREFGKTYATTEEFQRRKEIFDINLQTIVSHNAKTDLKQGGHVLGVNPFADMMPDELPRGYNKMQSSRYSASSSTARRRHRRQLQGKQQQQQLLEEDNHLPFMVEPESSLPVAVDWRTQGVTTPVKSQGACGSCWAFASTAVLESHIALQTGLLFSLSEQELVSCASNPRHCGGTGGCAGSTAEIAFELVMQKGIVQEWDFGYQSYHAENVECTLKEKTTPYRKSAVRGTNKDLLSSNSTLYKGAVASIDGYVTLPSNKYLVLMNAVAKLGPVAVSVACLPWHLYKGGVFYAPLNTTRSTDVGKQSYRSESITYDEVNTLTCSPCAFIVYRPPGSARRLWY